MDGGEERDILATQDEILTMVKRLVVDQERFETQVNGRLDRLQKTIIGNGENERAVLPRVRVIERTLEERGRLLSQHDKDIEENTKFREAWKNRIIGMGMLIPILLALLIVLASYLAGNVLAP